VAGLRRKECSSNIQVIVVRQDYKVDIWINLKTIYVFRIDFFLFVYFLLCTIENLLRQMKDICKEMVLYIDNRLLFWQTMDTAQCHADKS